ESDESIWRLTRIGGRLPEGRARKSDPSLCDTTSRGPVESDRAVSGRVLFVTADRWARGQTQPGRWPGSIRRPSAEEDVLWRRRKPRRRRPRRRRRRSANAWRPRWVAEAHPVLNPTRKKRPIGP